jgi:hypothetical protein
VTITPEILDWLHRSAERDGGAYSIVLLHLIKRVEALEAQTLAAQPTPNFRALCAELADELQGYKVAHPMHCRVLLNRARAALAQPEGEGLSAAVLNCYLDGPPPAPHASFSDWFRKEGSKGILVGLRISALPSRAGSTLPTPSLLDELMASANAIPLGEVEVQP